MKQSDHEQGISSPTGSAIVEVHDLDDELVDTEDFAVRDIRPDELV